jgi:hypothetical protein
MYALQSLSTSGVHARRCSSVPCEKEGVNETVANIKASDARHCVKGDIRSSIDLFRLSAFIRGLAIRIEVDTHQSGYEYTLAGARACSETLAFVAFGLAAVHVLSESGSAVDRRSSTTSGRRNHKVSAHLSKR